MSALPGGYFYCITYNVVVLVEEGGLDEDGGHGRAAQDGEVGAQLDAAVREGLVDAADVAVQGVLHIMGEDIAPRRAVVAVSLAATAAAGIGMDGDEEVGRPVVGHARDIREFGGFAAQVVALQHGDVVAIVFERNGAVLGDHGVDFGFDDAIVVVDGAAVADFVVLADLRYTRSGGSGRVVFAAWDPLLLAEAQDGLIFANDRCGFRLRQAARRLLCGRLLH